MSGCVYRSEDNKCKFWSDYGKGIVTYCDPCDCNEKTTTNANRIRAMTDEELAHFMTPENYKFPCPPNHNDCQYELIPCWMCWARWLKSPVEVQDG